jgi:thiol:disulfide interchange protein DsbD
LLLLLALVFIKPVIGLFAYRLGWAALLIFFGVLSGAFDPVSEGSWRSKFGKTAGIFALLLAAALIFFGFFEKTGYGSTQMSAPSQTETTQGDDIGWLNSDTEGLRQAGLSGRPILVDFFAEWCAACHELDEKTWTDSSVRSLLDKFILVKLDLTKNSEQVRKWQKAYSIVGMPTVILLSSTGVEQRRFEGFKPPKDVKPLLESML